MKRCKRDTEGKRERESVEKRRRAVQKEGWKKGAKARRKGQRREDRGNHAALCQTPLSYSKLSGYLRRGNDGTCYRRRPPAETRHCVHVRAALLPFLAYLFFPFASPLRPLQPSTIPSFFTFILIFAFPFYPAFELRFDQPNTPKYPVRA